MNSLGRLRFETRVLNEAPQAYAAVSALCSLASSVQKVKCCLDGEGAHKSPMERGLSWDTDLT